jgi:hypothetical protein
MTMKTSGARHFASNSHLSKIDGLFTAVLLFGSTLYVMGGAIAMIVAGVPTGI